ncbi:MAG: hypothetical protein EXR99_08650 [Gemmataceae bacterium]|nr:hypothetical protein [Gemmataceae bacterium]
MKMEMPAGETTRLVVAYLHSGGFPQVAARSAGIPLKVFRAWMKEGQREKAPALLREFYLAVTQAQAQARLRAEITAFNDKPLEWLKHGPGKSRGKECGWGPSAKGKGKKEVEASSLLEIPGLARELKKLLEMLEPYPAARKALSEALEKDAAGLEFDES